MKHFAFAKASGSRESLHRWLLDRLGTGKLSGCSAVAVNLVMDPDAPWDAVIELWSTGDAATPGGFPAELAPRSLRTATYRVTELPGKDEGPDRAWPTIGVKALCPWVGRRGVSTTELRRHWDEHVPLANRIHIGVTRYVRNWVEDPTPGTDSTQPAYQGVATQHFLSARDLRERMFDRPESARLIADDVADFVGPYDFLVSTEYFRALAD